MKSIIILSTLILLFSANAIAHDENSKDHAERKFAIVRSDEVIDDDYFAFADKIEIYGTVNGDVYAFGGQILIDGIVNGDLLASGGTINISGKISQDARIAGGQLSITGKVDRNLTIAGGSIELATPGTIGGSVLAAGGNVLLAAPVGRNVKISAGNLVISNKINGNVEAFVGEIRLTPRAVVTGDLTYLSSQAASIDEKATISGSVIRKTPPDFFKMSRGEVLGFLFGTYLFATLINFISTLILGLLFIYLLPKYNQSIVSNLRNRPLASLGLGIVFLILTPVVILLFLMTVVGIPIAFILLALFLVTLYLVRIFVIFWAGLSLFKWFGKTVHEGWAFLLGLVIYSLLTLIPIIGATVTLVVLLFGLGATLLVEKELYSAMRKQGTI